ncbi:MAG TPA: hypothetical protein VG319_04200 [Polyangia bacterium]|nr:hypothetical protein [Polyangia bacterium]
MRSSAVTTHRSTRPRATAGPRAAAGLLATLAFCAAAGCDLPAEPRHPKLLTLAGLEALADPMNPDATFAEDSGVPGGLRVRDYVTKDDAGYHLTLRETWTEQYRSAYVTAEVWTGFDEVWLQPVYAPITGFVDGVPAKLVDPAKGGWSPIFSVGAGSAFYSPFWQVRYFQVPDGTDPAAFTSARQVIDSGLPLIQGPARVLSLVPGAVGLPQTAAGSGQEIGGPQGVGSGFLDGQPVSFLDFGADTFSWNGDLVIDETPLFVLVYRDAGGNLARMNVPTVAGTGPLYANRPPKIVDGVPRYGAYWRLYTVEVPPTARIFAPPTLFVAESADYPMALVGSSYGQDIIDTGKDGVAPWLGRVALNAIGAADGSTKSCFDSYKQIDTVEYGNTVPDPCVWLDSQAAIEQLMPHEAIKRTDVLVTCPFVSYHDAAVTP